MTALGLLTLHSQLSGLLSAAKCIANTTHIWYRARVYAFWTSISLATPKDKDWIG